jgi:cell wall-associated NlpC family hydrolase
VSLVRTHAKTSGFFVRGKRLNGQAKAVCKPYIGGFSLTRNAIVWILVTTALLLVGLLLFDIWQNSNDNVSRTPDHIADNGNQTPENGADGVIPRDESGIKEGVTDDLRGAVEAFEEAQMRVGDLGLEYMPGLKTFAVLKKSWPWKGSPYAQSAIALGHKYLGTPYLYGSNRGDDSSFDCSDFTYWIYLKATGLNLPKDSRSQREYVQKFGSNRRSAANWRLAKPGDLMFFGSYRGYRPENYAGVDKATARVTHCGIYLGNGQLLHTASAPTGVRIQKIENTHLEWRLLYSGRPW